MRVPATCVEYQPDPRVQADDVRRGRMWKLNRHYLARCGRAWLTIVSESPAAHAYH